MKERRIYVSPEVAPLYEQRTRRWYSGTTVENFIQCASEGANGTVIYDKAKAPHDYPGQVYVIGNPYSALGVSIQEAAGLGHRPLVISCMPRLEDVLGDIGIMGPDGIAELRNPIEIDQVWCLKEGLDIAAISPNQNPMFFSPRSHPEFLDSIPASQALARFKKNT